MRTEARRTLIRVGVRAVDRPSWHYQYYHALCTINYLKNLTALSVVCFEIRPKTMFKLVAKCCEELLQKGLCDTMIVE